jgi:hypothetical protein
VTLTPLLRRIKVFKRGTEKGEIEIIPFGGQFNPYSIEGAAALSKKHQKKLKKKKTSDKIKRSIPIRILISNF